MRGLHAIACVAAISCTGDPDGGADTPGHIYTIAGTGDEAWDDAGQNLSFPNDLVIDAATGTLYISDFNHFVVRARELDGAMRVIAGNGELGDPVEGVAVEARFNHVGDLLLDGEGGLYLAAWHNGRVVRVDLASGQLRHVAGQGTRQKYDGDGGPAIEADISLPSSLALHPDGRLLVTDQENQVLRAIDRGTGTIDHFAGRCVVAPQTSCDNPQPCPDNQKLACDLSQCSYPCTPSPAGEVSTLDELRFAFDYGAVVLPAGKLAVAADGSIAVADNLDYRVRAIRPDGRVETLARDVNAPTDIALATDGTLFIVDQYDHCVQRVDPDGTSHVIAGVCGQRGFAGDAGPAADALLSRPLGIALDEGGRRLYIADTGNHRIRYVTLPRSP